MNEIEKPDSAAVRWAARLAYCAMTPFVLVGGLIVDLHSFNLRVAITVHDAFGGDDPAVPEVAVGMVNLAVGSVGVAGSMIGLKYVICALKAST